MKKILKDNENRIITILLALTVIVAISPLISKYCINGHDLDYHLLRIEALKENILMGRPFLKVNSLYFGGAGYASSMFYSDFLLYIPAVLRVFGVSIGLSYHIFAAVCVILCMLSMYYCVYKMSGSKYAGALAAILVTLCPYHMDDVMVRAATGEYMAFIFIPFVLYGIYNLLYEGMDKPWIIGVGFGGVLLSHTASFVMCIIFAVAAVIVKIRKLIDNPKTIIRLILTALVTAAATSLLWLPMLEQFMSAKFSVTAGAGVDMLDAAVDFSQILSQQFPTVGIVLILFAIPRVFISKNGDTLVEYADWMLLGAVLFCILSTNLLPWQYLSRILSFIQFPWRFFLIASVLFAMSDAIYVRCFISKIIKGLNISDTANVIWEAVIVLIFVVASGMALTHQTENAQGYYDYSNDYYSYKPYTANVIGGEWLPASVYDRNKLLDQSEIMTDSKGMAVDFVRSRGKVIATIDRESDYVDVPLLYYKGYSAVIRGNEGNAKLAITGDGDNGLCRVYTNGATGELTVNYTGTPLQMVSYVLSIFAIAFVVFYIVKTAGKETKGE